MIRRKGKLFLPPTRAGTSLYKILFSDAIETSIHSRVIKFPAMLLPRPAVAGPAKSGEKHQMGFTFPHCPFHSRSFVVGFSLSPTTTTLTICKTRVDIPFERNFIHVLIFCVSYFSVPIFRCRRCRTKVHPMPVPEGIGIGMRLQIIECIHSHFRLRAE